MSTTPRTDDAKEQYLTGKMGIYGVLDEARKFETELAAAIQISAKYENRYFKTLAELADMKARAEKAETELARAHDIIKRASVQFFHDGTDGDAAAKMLTVLNDAAMKEASK
jgi:hypothetical protein